MLILLIYGGRVKNSGKPAFKILARSHIYVHVLETFVQEIFVLVHKNKIIPGGFYI